MYDVFSGIGYDTHTRLSVLRDAEGSTYARLEAGQRLPQNVVKQLLASIDRKVQYQHIGE
jgi:hypothetical protein